MIYIWLYIYVGIYQASQNDTIFCKSSNAQRVCPLQWRSILCKEPWEPNEMSMTCFPLPASSNMLVDVSWTSSLWITMIQAIKHSCTHWCSRLSHYAIVCAYMCFSSFLIHCWMREMMNNCAPQMPQLPLHNLQVWRDLTIAWIIKKQLVSLQLSQTCIDGDVLLPSRNSLKDWICMVWRSTSSGIVSLPHTTWWSRCPHNCVRFTLQQTKIAGWELSLFNMEIQIFKINASGRTM